MIELHSWSNDDLDILHLTLGDPQVMQHLGGVESSEQVAQRHERYLKRSHPNEGEMFTIRLEAGSITVGSIGFWERTWKQKLVYETGWMVLPAYARQGIATKAARVVVSLAASHRRHQFLHAFPSVVNVASNIVCDRAGFTNLGECTFEYPNGQFMQCNDWQINLFATQENRPG